MYDHQVSRIPGVGMTVGKKVYCRSSQPQACEHVYLQDQISWRVKDRLICSLAGTSERYATPGNACTRALSSASSVGHSRIHYPVETPSVVVDSKGVVET